ncbi:MAG: type II toxin-antitoxin system PemK/MazF family toxin [Rhodospirillales bacterium]|nr:type II toxin-antitoxin system PemK/MazF family toxin [Rhodospirillales bacterium]
MPTARATPVCDPFDVVALPFPYGERPVRQRRPGLVISASFLAREQGLVWVAMITAGANPAQPGDIAIADWAEAGLPIASVIRPGKIATVEADRLEILGRLDPATIAQVQAALARLGAAWLTRPS